MAHTQTMAALGTSSSNSRHLSLQLSAVRACTLLRSQLVCVTIQSQPSKHVTIDLPKGRHMANEEVTQNKSTMELREALADEEFESYDFGEGVRVSESDNWCTDDPLDFTKIAYITCDGDDPDADSERVSFHVRFESNGSVSDAYGLLMKNGSDIGWRGSKLALSEAQALADTWSSGG
jgi:hypothetical protein